ncbi:unnamed protein product [Closterium sp. Naga37s-1]|nr:unnamed protein product [Closterium sp. Naga37s-1]
MLDPSRPFNTTHIPHPPVHAFPATPLHFQPPDVSRARIAIHLSSHHQLPIESHPLDSPFAVAPSSTAIVLTRPSLPSMPSLQPPSIFMLLTSLKLDSPFARRPIVNFRLNHTPFPFLYAFPSPFALPFSLLTSLELDSPFARRPIFYQSRTHAPLPPIHLFPALHSLSLLIYASKLTPLTRCSSLTSLTAPLTACSVPRVSAPSSTSPHPARTH